jgi:hypothetical protein
VRPRSSGRYSYLQKRTPSGFAGLSVYLWGPIHTTLRRQHAPDDSRSESMRGAYDGVYREVADCTDHREEGKEKRYSSQKHIHDWGLTEACQSGKTVWKGENYFWADTQGQSTTGPGK